MRPEDCKHENFQCKADVQRLIDENKPDQVNAFIVELKIHCIDCGLPFEWIGFTAGYRGDAPRVDIAAQELRAPIKPKGCKIMPGIPGFDIRAN